jgi:hypothetical protein
VILDFKAGEQKAPGYTDKFPFGQVGHTARGRGVMLADTLLPGPETKLL